MPSATRAVLAGLLLAVGFLVAPAGAAEPGRVVPVPASIDATGRTDVTAALDAFFAGLSPGSTVTFPAGGRYRVEGVLLLVNQRDLTIEGNGATFFASTDGRAVPPPRRGFGAAWPRRREHWHVQGGSGITIRDVVVQGANPHAGATAAAYVPTLEGQAGFAIARASGVVLDRVRVRDTYGDFVWLTGRTSDVTIRDSTFEGSGRQGIALVNASHVVVEDNHLDGVARTVFDLEPLGRARVEDVRFRGNTVGDYTNFLLSAGGGGPGVNDVWLQDNRVDGGNGIAVSAGSSRQARRGYHVLGNTGTGTAQAPAGTGRTGLIQLVNLRDVEVRDNAQRVGGGPAISADRVCNLTVAGNRFPGAAREEEVTAPCGAAAPAPSRAVPTTVPVPPASAAAPAGGGGDAGTDPWLAAALGFGGGLAVAGAVAVVVVRHRRGPGPSA